mgnify:CR=1 FL=1
MASAPPQMRRAEAVGKSQKILAVHDRLLEHARGGGKFMLRQAQVLEQLADEAFGKLAVVAAHQRAASTDDAPGRSTWLRTYNFFDRSAMKRRTRKSGDVCPVANRSALLT